MIQAELVGHDDHTVVRHALGNPVMAAHSFQPPDFVGVGEGDAVHLVGAEFLKQRAEALDALWESYDDWSHSQTYLHIVSHHDAVDDAEAMYRRAIAFGETEELSEFHAELSDLRDQLRLIAEMEALNIRNVL